MPENIDGLDPTISTSSFKPEKISAPFPEWNSKEIVDKFKKTVGELDSQPQSTQKIFQDPEINKDILQHIIEIDNKIFLFSSNHNGKVLALVQDEEGSKIYRPRFFRISNSDGQFKVHPGTRNEGELLKGQESDKNHHYVQSNKLCLDVINALQSLPKIDDKSDFSRIEYKFKQFLPKRTSKSPDVFTHPEDLSFSEEQLVFKDENWNIIKKILEQNFYLYRKINFSNIKNSQIQDLFSFVKYNSDSYIVSGCIPKQELDELSQAYEKLSEKEKTSAFSLYKNNENNTPVQKDFSIRLERMFSTITQKSVAYEDKFVKFMEQNNFIPDFSQLPVKRYRLDSQRGAYIDIEEYDQISSAGDHLRWAMARDSHGRVYINNIYSPDVGIDSYGTPKLKTNFGLLVYKPTDYDTQIKYIKEQFLTRVDSDYVDISKFISQQYPIKKYQEVLEQRKIA
jgi:hypothetical protein